MTDLPHFGIVIRKDGTVPFDDDVHPAHKAAMLAHLAEAGHEIEHADDGSVRLTSGPLAPE